MIHLPFVHSSAFEIIETRKDLPRHKPKKLAHFYSLQPLRQDKVSASSASDVLDLAISYDRLEPEIEPQFCQMVAPQRLIHRAVLLQIPDGKLIGVDKRSASLVGVAIDDHLSPSTVAMQSLEQVEQAFDVKVICVFLLLGDSHVQDQFSEIIELVVRVEPHCGKKGASVYGILKGFCQGVALEPFGDDADLVVKISPHLIISKEQQQQGKGITGTQAWMKLAKVSLLGGTGFSSTKAGMLTERSVLQSGQLLLILSHQLMHFEWQLCLHLRSLSRSLAQNSMQQIEHSMSSKLKTYLFSGINQIRLGLRPVYLEVFRRLAFSWIRRLILYMVLTSSRIIRLISPNLRGSSMAMSAAQLRVFDVLAALVLALLVLQPVLAQGFVFALMLEFVLVLVLVFAFMLALEFLIAFMLELVLERTVVG